MSGDVIAGDAEATPVWLRQVRLLFADVSLFATSGPSIGLLRASETVPRKEGYRRKKRPAELTAAHEGELRRLLPQHTAKGGRVDWIGLMEAGDLVRDLEPNVLREAAKKWKP